jgi:hypothetical protein
MKNVLFWIGVRSNSEYLRNKHGDFKYLDYSKRVWEIWCKDNDVIFFEYTTPSESDHTAHKPTWTRWFDVIDQIETAGIDWKKIALIDGSTMVRRGTPNFFEMVGDDLVAFRSLENLRWVSEGVNGYANMFPDVKFDMAKYISCGFQIFSKKHVPFLKELKQFYYGNYNDIMKLQNESVKRGTDQPVYNYLLQRHNINVDMSLPKPFMLTHMNRFDWFSYNWQLKSDMTPFFLKYGYIYFYSGFTNRGDRESLMQQTWEIIKGEYE